MPHSISPKKEPKSEDMDTEIPDAQLPPATEGEENQDEDQDMTMADPGVQGDPVPTIKNEVNLSEFLFDDMESDEEFPESSKAQDAKPSSPLEAPTSPMYVI